MSDKMNRFFLKATINTFKGFGNILLNGFSFDLSKEDKAKRVSVTLPHFQPINKWSLHQNQIVDCTTGASYSNDSKETIRKKCAALFAFSLIVQPIGLTLNIFNRVAKIFTLAQLWKPSKNKYEFKARICEYGKDLLIVISTSLIFIGFIFSSFYGTITPYNGRKLFASFERLAYSSGYQTFNIRKNFKDLQVYLLAPCFQPSPTIHLGGAAISENNIW